MIFFRLAYRLAIGGSEKFKTFTHRILPLADNQLDETNEEVFAPSFITLMGFAYSKK
ncbi:hypothetical protein [Methylocucumis oryzae]|uniref:hypothetical protein n=1 Tax=Methylocucumis oryzae TaxID=1632867 RepID=UPI00195529FE|nr:hypothetical protein [Methylocucumis oryzae]